MGISTSMYYYRPKISRAERDKRDADLRDKIEHVQGEYSCYGYRTIKHQLERTQGIVVNAKKLLRIMRKHNLFRQIKHGFIKTTDSDHAHPVYPNLIKGKEITDINQVYVSDITYIRILTGFVFLAVILDVFSRRVIGWALSKRIDHSLTLEALKMAIEQRKPKPGVIHHSDRGVQYACKEYVSELKNNGFQISMSSKGNPYHNAYAESFMKTIKNEEVYLWEYESFTDVIDSVPRFIEEVYNRKRVHSGIKYLPPVEFEAMLKNNEQKKELGQVILKISD